MRKYTDEQLSRILSAAAKGKLGRFSAHHRDDSTMCLEQAAHASNGIGGHGGGRRYRDYDDDKITAWDRAEKRPRTPDRVLRWLEKHGMA